MKMKLIFAMIANVICTIALAQTPLERKTERYFESIKSQPKQLAVFLTNLPKGGDLHTHGPGTSYAENMLKYAYVDNLCVNQNTYTVFSKPNCELQNRLNNAVKNKSFRDALIDAWSMRHFSSKKESGHDHFFATFQKFGLITSMHSAEVLSEAVERAGLQNEQYMESMETPEFESAELGKKLGWNPDFKVMRDSLLKANFNKIINDISSRLDRDETKMRTLLACDTQQPSAGCKVKLRYLYQVLREQAPEIVFAQLLAGFEAVSKDKRMVGVNMVQPEDGLISMRDYKLHMQMVGYLHQLYPNVRISLHAGELNSAIVPADGLTFHINDAVNVAHADRIGHGVDIEHENNADQLLKEMAARHIMVEINLTSNAVILNVEGKSHPLPLYLQYGVPVALSTDDEGINRSNLTKEFERAVSTFHLSYPTLKQLIRNSMEYSFLSGKSLWKNDAYQQMVTECEKDIPGAANPSHSCEAFIGANDKANAQWELEKRLMKFESNTSTSPIV